MRPDDVEHLYEAYAAEGAPLCIAGKSTPKHPDGISVAIYFTRKGRIKGVSVFDGAAEEFLAVVGKVPDDIREAYEQQEEED